MIFVIQSFGKSFFFSFFVFQESIFLILNSVLDRETRVCENIIQLLDFHLLCMSHIFLMEANYRLLWDLATKEMLLSFIC